MHPKPSPILYGGELAALFSLVFLYLSAAEASEQSIDLYRSKKHLKDKSLLETLLFAILRNLIIYLASLLFIIKIPIIS